ncbi:PTS glucose transporter subunit IIA [Oceanobacillus luteolus]|uniref:PTS glucose transporter subunit IIA n=1 Tax=Oceanobacillus luteolus TaxID=1274358 RepID=A0ABW4HUV2_9BACI|nr:PTS glucose transporter subunit IIA [Oceanobacillus luteolus]MCM3741397.1 PTS glucose transporter subunit IIA [Oceanobacillus luteolus]
MFGRLFKKQEVKEISLVTPMSGEVISLEEVPDPVFSQKMMGDGIAVIPTDGTVVSPVNGEIIQVFPTKHAIGILGDNDAQILIHIGIETVSLQGEGFTVNVAKGDRVKQGDPLMQVDLNIIEEKASSAITPIIITNSDEMSEIEKKSEKQVKAGEQEILFVRK